MRNLIALLLIATQVFLAPVSVAALSDVDKQFISFKNELTNSGFESSKAGWVATTAILTTDSTNYFEGKASGLLTFTATTGDATATVTPGGQYAGVNMEASCMVKTSLSTIQVCAVQAGVESNCSNVPATGSFVSVPVSFIGASGSSAVKIKTTASTTGTVNIDACYLGRSKGVGSAFLATAYQPYTPTFTGFGTVTSSSFYYALVNDSLYIKGKFTLGTTTAVPAQITLPTGITINSSAIPTIMTTGSYFRNGVTVAKGGPLLISGGNNYFNFSDAQVFGSGSVSAQTIANASAFVGSGEIITVEAGPIPVTGSYVVNVINTNITPGNWSGISTLGGSTTSGSYADPTSVTGAVTTSGTPRNISCITNASSKMGIDCTLPRIGNYQVCYNGYANTSVNSPGARLVDGAGTVVVGEQGAGINLGQSITYGGCASYYVSSLASATTFKVQGITNTGTLTMKTTSFSVTELDAPMPAPVLTGNVTSNSTGAERIERLSVNTQCTSTPCTVSSQSSAWFSSVSRTSTGFYTVNINSGVFSATPNCHIAGIQFSGYPVAYFPSVPTSTSIPFRIGDAAKHSRQ